MLKIIEKSIEHPIRMLAKPGVKLIAGCACALVEYNNNLVIDICKPEQRAFGIIGKSQHIRGTDISFDLKNMVPIWNQKMIFQTSYFEKNLYLSEDKLYVGLSGMLTNEPVVDENNFVARLTVPPNDKLKYLECLWL